MNLIFKLNKNNKIQHLKILILLTPMKQVKLQNKTIGAISLILILAFLKKNSLLQNLIKIFKNKKV